MLATVQTVHALGMKVAAHIYPAAAIENAVRAGVDSVEHGSFATAQTFALMKEHGTFLVPKRNLALAVRSGVWIAFGTDIGEGDHAMEFGLLIANGMSPADALATATRWAIQRDSSRLNS